MFSNRSANDTILKRLLDAFRTMTLFYNFLASVSSLAFVPSFGSSIPMESRCSHSSIQRIKPSVLKTMLVMSSRQNHLHYQIIEDASLAWWHDIDIKWFWYTCYTWNFSFRITLEQFNSAHKFSGIRYCHNAYQMSFQAHSQTPPLVPWMQFGEVDVCVSQWVIVQRR